MSSPVHPIVLIAFIGVAVVLAASAIAIYVRVPLKLTRMGVAVSLLPSLVMLVLFYSLAIHMRQSLGAWPTAIGERGFPPLLITHATITVDFFIAMLLSSISVFPVAIIVCLLVQRWRRCFPYLVLYVAMFFVCWGFMQFAPEPFLYWWRD